MDAYLKLQEFHVMSLVDTTCWWHDLAEELIKRGAPTEICRSRKLQRLAYHLHLLQAKSVVIHEGYLCGDYLADHAAYYSKMARPPKQRCIRLLFFNKDYGKEEKGKNTVRLGLPGMSMEEDAETNGDVGLICTSVIRPTPDCLLGRTIVKAHNLDGYVTCSDPYPCHLYGAPLCVWGVPWLEQDPAIFVCGGAALWVCGFHTQGRLSPFGHASPGQITAVARKYGVSGHVGAGMLTTEMATAIHEWGYQPYNCFLKIKKNDLEEGTDLEGEDNLKKKIREFVTRLHLLVESGISPILCYYKKGTAHAVVVVGHDLHNIPRQDFLQDDVDEVCLQSTSDWIGHFIVVDDQRAPYWNIPIRPGEEQKQPLSREKVNSWISGETVKGNNTRNFEPSSLIDCDRLRLLAPLPMEVKVLPEDVRSLVEDGMAFLQSSKNPDIKKGFKNFFENKNSYAIRARLIQLWKFHWYLKKAPYWSSLAQDIRDIYWKMTWPTWLWVCQLVKLPDATRPKNDPNYWKCASVVGEVLLDATASPRGYKPGNSPVFSIRFEQYLFYFPEENKKNWESFRSKTSPKKWRYPLCDDCMQ